MSTAPRRIAPIDVARGSAMVLVFLAHYLQEVMSQVPGSDGRAGFRLLDALTNAAAPAFMLISGMTLAFTLEGLAGEALDRRRAIVIDRALFMLVVGHILLTITDALLATGDRPVGQVFITDTIALSLILGVLILPRWRAGRLALLAAVLLAAAWIIYLCWRPASPFLQGVASAFGGPIGQGPISYAFPVLPWASAFFVGAIIGQHLAPAVAAESTARWAQRLVLGATVVIVAGVLVRLAVRSMPGLSPEISDMLSLSARMPPGPVHLAVFGGLALIILGASFMLPAGNATSFLGTLGRTSFFVFLLQSLVYRDVVSRLPLSAPWTWVAVFVVSVAVIGLVARWWDRVGGNRWLSFGSLKLGG